MSRNKIIRRELAVGVTGNADELNLSNFEGVKVEIDQPLSAITEDEQISLGRTICEMAVTAGLLADPLIIKNGVCSVLLSEREVRRDFPDGGWEGSSTYMYFHQPFPFTNPPVAKVFFNFLDRTIDDSKNQR